MAMGVSFASIFRGSNVYRGSQFFGETHVFEGFTFLGGIHPFRSFSQLGGSSMLKEILYPTDSHAYVSVYPFTSPNMGEPYGPYSLNMPLPLDQNLFPNT